MEIGRQSCERISLDRCKTIERGIPERRTRTGECALFASRRGCPARSSDKHRSIGAATALVALEGEIQGE